MIAIKSEDISYKNDNIVLDETLCSPKEAVIVSVSQKIIDGDILRANLRQLMTLSNQVCLDIPPNMIPVWTMGELFQPGMQVFIRMKIEEQPTVYEGNLGSYVGNMAFVRKFEEYQKLLPDYMTSVSIEIDDSHLTQLGATLYRLYDKGIRTFYLDSQKDPYHPKIKEIADAFEYLTMVGATEAQIYFPFIKNPRAWNLLTRNTYSGLEDIHVDLSNRCTHSCHFCGLYSDDNIQELKAETGKIGKHYIDFMKKEIETRQAVDFIHSLPWTVRGIQFGGVGDPLMHPDAIEILSAARERGFRIQVLSNMDYLDEEKILKLHRLATYGKTSEYSLRFIVNCSGSTAESYIQTRPKQNKKVFDRVVSNLKRLSELREKTDGRGVNFSIMCVVTSMNYQESERMVEFAKDVGARELWLKPMEIHTNWMHKYMLSDQQKKEFRQILPRVFKLADEYKIDLGERSLLEATASGGAGSE